MPMPSANGNISIMDKEFGINSKKSTEELKRQVGKLKADLEAERSKLKQVHRDKTAELKRIQENHEKERHRTVENVTKRLQSEHAVELRRVRETLSKEKDNELRQVLKFKEEELKSLKQQIHDDKDRSKRTEEDIKKSFLDRSRAYSSEIEHKLRDELTDVKEQKRKLDELYKLKCASDYEKAELIRRLKSEHEREISALIRESKREVAKEFHHLKSAERALEEKNHELAFKDQLTRKLEAEKHGRKTSIDSSLSDSPLRSRLGSGTSEAHLVEVSPETDEVFQSSPKGRHDKERELRKKNADLQSRLDQLEKKCNMLEKDNASKQAGSTKTTGIVEEKVKKLKKRNSELVSIARQLEERAKKLQEEKNATLKKANSKADPSAEVEHMKKMFARQRAKDLAEQAKSHLQKDSEIENLRKQLDSLTGAQCETQNDKIDDLQAIIKKTAKERLMLEKKLALVESPRSTPCLPAVSDERLGTRLKSSGVDSVHLQKELDIKENECEQLKKSAQEMKVKCSKLELEREKFAAKCTMLHQKNAELGKRMKELNKLEDEIQTLKENLKKVEEQRHVLDLECLKLREQLKGLMHVKEDLETSEQQRKQLEKQHISSVSRLKEREEEIRQLHKIQEEATRSHRLAVTSLEQDVRTLQQKCVDSNDRANNLKNELEKLKTAKTSNQNKSTQTSPVKSPVLRHESRDVREKEIKTEKEVANLSDNDILDVAASRIKQLEVSDSDEDSLSSPPLSNKKAKVNHSDDDDIALLSRRIRQATCSDESASILDENYESDVSRDVSSMADGDLADMEDNDVTTSIIDGEETCNSLSSYLDNNKNISKGNIIPNKIIPKREASLNDQRIDEKYLVQEQDDDSELDIDEDNLAVYIARYSYDPYQHSPNDFPDAELAFQAGDYLYVFGDIDEDGFYLGELMDGQRGLVPSNFVEKIADESELPWIVNGEQDENAGDYESDEEEAERKLHRNLRLNVEHIPDSNLGDIEEEDDEESREVLNSSHDGFRSDDTDLEPIRVPSPKHVMLERQHTRSVVINWRAADLPQDEVKGYGVYVNGEMKMIIKGGNNTKALIEDIDSNKTYRVSVRTITAFGDESQDQEAMLTIGKDASVAPSNIQVSDVSPTSAKIEWLPGNSSYSHEIVVNGTPLRTIKPGTYQYTLTNLEPKEHYRVHVRARNPRISLLDEDSKDIEQDSLAKAIEFTTQEGGAPEPPLNVNLVPTTSRSGPNTLEVSWIPVTITEQGTSNGARVTGYKVYINDVSCAEVTSPTADCVTVASWMIERAVKKTKAETVLLTVRTQSLCGESIPSNTLSIPVHTFNFQANKLIGAQPLGTPVKPKHADSLQNEIKAEDRDKHNSVESENNKQDTTKPIAKPRQDMLIPPVPKARTKGKPVVWKVDVEEDDSCEDSNRSGENSTLDEDEQVEICSTDLNEQQQQQQKQQQLMIPTKDKQCKSDEDGQVKMSNINSNGQKYTTTAKDMINGQPKDNDELKEVKMSNVHLNEQTYTPTTTKDATSGRPDKGKDEQVKMSYIDDQENTTAAKNIASKQSQRQEDDNDKHEKINEEDRAAKEEEETLNKESQRANNEDATNDEFPERKISGLSDIDMDELNKSLKSATSYKRDKKTKSKRDAKEPFLTPVDLSDSEIGDSSDESLSVIDEEDEGMGAEEGMDTEGADTSTKRNSRSSRTQSATDGFQSDDDVMDLLDDEPEENNIHALTAANVRKFSLEQKAIEGQDGASGNETNQGLIKYLVSTENQPQSNIDNEQEEELKNQTYSDVEADQFEATAPYETSTPTLPRKDMDNEPQDTSTDNDVTSNRTYTLEENEQMVDEIQEDEVIRIFIALYDYNPVIQSPNPDAEEEELAFNEGDLIKIYGDIDPDGFYWGEMDGRAGFVPHNMVSEVQVDEEDLLDQSPSPLPESQAHDFPHEVPNQYVNEDGINEAPNTGQQNEVHHTDMVPSSNKYPVDNVPDSQYAESDNQRNKLLIDGAQSKYPTVIVHKPSDASLHEPTFRKDSIPNPQDVTNDTYTLSDADDSFGYEDPRNSLNYTLEPKKMVALFDYDPQMLSPNPDNEVELKFRSGDILYVYGEMDEDGFYTGELGGVRGLVPSNFLENFQETSLPSTQEQSDTSVVSEESTPGPSKTPNGTQPHKEEPVKKKKGIFSKGKQILKKMTKGQASKK